MADDSNQEVFSIETSGEIGAQCVTPPVDNGKNE